MTQRPKGYQPEGKGLTVLQLEIAKLELRPGDILVVRMPDGTHRRRVQDTFRILEKIKPAGVAAALFVGDIEFTVVTPEKEEEQHDPTAQ